MEVHVTLTALAVFVIIFILFLVGLLFYLYPVAGKTLTIPGPNPSDARDGNISDIRKAGSLQEYLDELHNDYGEVTAFWHGTNSIISVSNIEHFAPRSQIFEIPDILFEGWRPLIGDQSFLFSQGINIFQRRENLEFCAGPKEKEFYGKLFLKVSTELADKWSSLPEGQHIPLTQHIRGLATKAICRMLLGDYFKDDTKVIKLHKAWEHCWTYVESLAVDESSVNLEKDFQKSLRDLKKLLEEALELRFENQSSGEPSTLLDGILISSKSSPTNEKQLVSDSLTQLTIGMHVTSSVVMWMMYFIASHPEVQDKLRKEVRKTSSLEIMPESVAKLKYLQQVLRESIRCGSVFSWAGRKQEIDIDVCGNTVPKNTPVLEAIGTAMQDEKLFVDPARFDPSRFSSDDVKIDPLTFIPFGFGGSRKNPQGSLVYLLASVVACTLIRRLKVTIAGDDAQIRPDSDYCSFVSKPSKEELWITVSAVDARRKDAETVGNAEK